MFTLSVGRGLEIVGPIDQADDAYQVRQNQPLMFRVDEAVAEKLRARNYEASASFDYLDNGEGRVQLLQVPILRPINEAVKRHARLLQVCDIHKTSTGTWLPARVPIHKQVAAMDHKGALGSDFGFLAETEIRDLKMEFTTYCRNP